MPLRPFRIATALKTASILVALSPTAALTRPPRPTVGWSGRLYATALCGLSRARGDVPYFTSLTLRHELVAPCTLKRLPGGLAAGRFTSIRTAVRKDERGHGGDAFEREFFSGSSAAPAGPTRVLGAFFVGAW